MRLLLFVALTIAAYLAWGSLRAGGVPGCGPESDCDKVLGSRWASVWGIPVSLLAVPIYLAALGATFPRNINWNVLITVATVILLVAIWFIGLQVVAIGAFCKFCLVAHIAGATAAALILRGSSLKTPQFIKPVAAGAALAVVLIAAQIAQPSPAPKQIATGLAPTSAITTNAAATPPSVPRSSGSSTFSIVQGQFILDLATVPVSGPMNAPKKVVKLFDYTCQHCRDLHHLLQAAKQQYPTELAIISLPMPLESTCNPVIRRTPPDHVNACEYARLALAVFFAEPPKFEEYSNWLFAPQRPPELVSAREQAMQLIGKERLLAALGDPRIDTQIRTDIEIYSANSRLGKSTAMPQLIFSDGTSIGAISEMRQLEEVLGNALGLNAARVR